MATLNSLKLALKHMPLVPSHQTQQLSEAQYVAGFDILEEGSRQTIYKEFIIPQLSLLLEPLFDSRSQVSVLEIGPGPKSVLGSLPLQLRRKINKYVAFEPNGTYATSLEKWLRPSSRREPPVFRGLGSLFDIRRVPFSPDSDAITSSGNNAGTTAERFDIILFCHSMYGMQPKHKFIERSLELLTEPSKDMVESMVVVFHRDGTLQLDGLTCYRTTSFPTGVIDLADEDEILDCFAPFIAGFVAQDADADRSLRTEWRKICRAQGRCKEAQPYRLLFSSPNVMAAFTRHAKTTTTVLPADVPLAKGEIRIKSWEARLHRSAPVMRPTDIHQVQQCVRWALDHKASLTVIGGGHSGHCIWPNTVAVDMSAFDQLHILKDSDSGPLVIAGAGCNTGDIIRMAMAEGLTVPLGSRPSVGAGLWLQGGIGHLSRLHGLTCDAIIGAVVVNGASCQTLYVGNVPSKYRPAYAVRAADEQDLLWAMKGAGTNIGILVSVTFKAYMAPTYTIRNWVLPVKDVHKARLKLSEFDEFVAQKLPRTSSADAYLYWEKGKMHLGVSVFETSKSAETPNSVPVPETPSLLGPVKSHMTVDSVGVFESEMYMTDMHNGHGGGKTSSFKRCLLLKRLGRPGLTDILVASVQARPTPLSYLHLLQGGGAVSDVAADATAFGCRDWDFACVITGVWSRDEDGTEVAQRAVDWVYGVARDLLPLSCGAYGADLGPDPRDAELAAVAFGPNRPRLTRLKNVFDPHNVLAYACPLPKAAIMGPRLIILVTGESGAGKDYCAEAWASSINQDRPYACPTGSLKARVVSISDAIKREYAAATGADLDLLLSDRAYKEQHRPSLTRYFQAMVQMRPQLPQENFLQVVYGATNVDVLFITGMRDEAPVATYSPFFPDSRVVEVRVQGEEGETAHQGHSGSTPSTTNNSGNIKAGPDTASLDYRPCLNFVNDLAGNEEAVKFLESHLLPFFRTNLEQLAGMVRPVSNFPRPGVQFRHVLNISQRRGGLGLCTALLQSSFTGQWPEVSSIVCCETGGFIYASALAVQVDVPLVLAREAGKLPPPTISVVKHPSNISSLDPTCEGEKRIEMERDLVSPGASVVLVDDVLATGETLCAMLELLRMAGVDARDVSILVVAEFPAHRGRELLRQRGFGRAHIRSLLVFGGD